MSVYRITGRPGSGRPSIFRAGGALGPGRFSAIFAICLLCLPAMAQDEGGGGGGDSGEAAAESDEDLAAEGEEAAESDDLSETTGLTLQERIRAVSRKTFLKKGRFELEPALGISTNDAFFRRWMVGARGSYHIIESLALDFGGSFAVFPEPLNPVRLISDDGGTVEFEDLSGFLGYADVGVDFAPIYGKVSLMSEYVIHFDAFVSGGLGATFDQVGSFVHPAMEIGLGTRIFLTDWLVLRTDLRDYIYPQDFANVFNVQNLLFLNVGLGIYFPFAFEHEVQAYKVEG
jgi:outer membrane beta-barrel protein